MTDKRSPQWEKAAMVVEDWNTWREGWHEAMSHVGEHELCNDCLLDLTKQIESALFAETHR